MEALKQEGFKKYERLQIKKIYPMCFVTFYTQKHKKSSYVNLKEKVFSFIQLFEPPYLSAVRELAGGGYAVCFPYCLRCLDAFALTEQ